MIRMLAERIDDRAFLGLIRKWLRAGILDTTGAILHPATGTPQGGVVSPVLSNETVEKPHWGPHDFAGLCRSGATLGLETNCE
jgi:retron-type reverse transcriptase